MATATARVPTAMAARYHHRWSTTGRTIRPPWGAWSPNLLGLAAIGTFFGLLLTWTILATLYFIIVWVISFFSDRDLTFRASWKLAGASLLPGALILTLGIFLYGLGIFDLVQLGFAFTMHLIIGWIYLLISPMFTAVHGMLGTTFGGNHLACAAGLAVLEIMEAEQLVDNADKVGNYLMQELQKMEGIKEVRGLGLMIGIEFDSPIKDIRRKLLFEKHIFTGVSGANVIRLLPPLTLTLEQAAYFMEKFKETLSELN
jgi:hypothetical protein